jgi:rfaE bifunctional protein kinase chain/domain
MQKIESVFQKFKSLKVLIVGDVMIDSYLWGKVERISPEAPVPILNIKKREERLGGAANVALNIQALGATPILCSVVGNDSEGQKFIDLLAAQQLTAQGIISSSNRITTIKHRMMADAHHLLRVDQETTSSITDEEQQILLSKIIELIKGVDVVIFEDYDKGVLNKNLIESIVSIANHHHIPTVVDPKKRNFLSYQGVTLFKPNKKELKEGLKIEHNLDTITLLDTAIDALLASMNVQSVLVTLSEQGAYFKSKNQQIHVPAHIRSISDVSGAGDTVISVASLCVALNLSSEFTVELSNLSGGLVCEKIGVVPIDKQQLMDEAIILGLGGALNE